MNRVFVLAVLGVSAGCATIDVKAVVEQKARILSVGETGCYPEEMDIREVRPQFGLTTWEIACQGKHFLCSADNDDRLSCSERATPASQPTASRR